ncbi:MAG: hypothetical protein N2489_09905 [Clostridia bacterium]|nr:hypothetical protein [Clostridia bacterium]
MKIIVCNVESFGCNGAQSQVTYSFEDCKNPVLMVTEKLSMYPKLLQDTVSATVKTLLDRGIKCDF